MLVFGRDQIVLAVSVSGVEDCVGNSVWVARCATVFWELFCEVVVASVVVLLCLCS